MIEGRRKYNLGSTIPRHDSWAFRAFFAPCFFLFLAVLAPIVGIVAFIWIPVKSHFYFRLCRCMRRSRSKSRSRSRSEHPTSVTVTSIRMSEAASEEEDVSFRDITDQSQSHTIQALHHTSTGTGGVFVDLERNAG